MVGPDCIVVAAIKSEAATNTGICGRCCYSYDVRLGFFISLFEKDLLFKVSNL